jgi:phosphoribosylglycinamide formyltransferase-1
MTSVLVNPVSSSHKSIAIFASGTGTNAKNIIEHFSQHPFINVQLVVCNKPTAGVVDIAAANQIPALLIDKEKFFRGTGYLNELKEAQIDFIVLAGFLWKIPQTLVDAYRNRIVNIHPALLPKFGGKGMYGTKVHEAVIAAGETESGITIHYANEDYDKGDIIFQASCPVLREDSAESLAEKIHGLEHKHYAKVIGKIMIEL